MPPAATTLAQYCQRVAGWRCGRARGVRDPRLRKRPQSSASSVASFGSSTTLRLRTRSTLPPIARYRCDIPCKMAEHQSSSMPVIRDEKETRNPASTPEPEQTFVPTPPWREGERRGASSAGELDSEGEKSPGSGRSPSGSGGRVRQRSSDYVHKGYYIDEGEAPSTSTRQLGAGPRRWP